MVASYKYVLRRELNIPMQDMDFAEVLFGAILYDEWLQKAPERARAAQEEAEQLVIEMRLIQRLIRGDAMPAVNP